MQYFYHHPRAAITTDAVILKQEPKTLQVLLIRRGNPPYKDYWALPGGFLDMDETLEQAVAREVEEETGLKNLNFVQVAAFSQVDRDPRGKTVTVAFLARANDVQEIKAADDAKEAKWFDVKNLPALAFDHGQIINEAIKVNQLKTT